MCVALSESQNVCGPVWITKCVWLPLSESQDVCGYHCLNHKMCVATTVWITKCVWLPLCESYLGIRRTGDQEHQKKSQKTHSLSTQQIWKLSDCSSRLFKTYKYFLFSLFFVFHMELEPVLRIRIFRDSILLFKYPDLDDIKYYYFQFFLIKKLKNICKTFVVRVLSEKGWNTIV